MSPIGIATGVAPQLALWLTPPWQVVSATFEKAQEKVNLFIPIQEAASEKALLGEINDT